MKELILIIISNTYRNGKRTRENITIMAKNFWPHPSLLHFVGHPICVQLIQLLSVAAQRPLRKFPLFYVCCAENTNTRVPLDTFARTVTLALTLRCRLILRNGPQGDSDVRADACLPLDSLRFIAAAVAADDEYD